MSRPVNHGVAWVENMSGRADVRVAFKHIQEGCVAETTNGLYIVGGQKSSKIDDAC